MNFVSLFAGIGGEHIALKRAVAKVCASSRNRFYACDVDPRRAASFAANFPETTFRVRDLAKTTALDEGFSTGEIDFLWASPFAPPEPPPKIASKTIRDCLRRDLPTKPLAGNRRDKATLARLEIARDAGYSDAIFPANGFGKSAYPFDGAFPTLTTRPMMFVGDNLRNYRYLTAPEAGAALGFPDDFIYVGAGSDAYRGVGGSVSVDATEAILTKLFGEVF